MRIAILSDIHGNSIALDAVLEDIKRRGGVDGYWLLGDYCAVGYDPVGVLERIQQLPSALIIRGNADSYILSRDLPPPTIEDAQQNPALIPHMAEVVGSFYWTRGMVESQGWISWLESLPCEQNITLPDETEVRLLHSSPQDEGGRGLNPALSDAEIADALNGLNADLLCVGHFHYPMSRQSGKTRIINPGSVSHSVTVNFYTGYALLTADKYKHDIQFIRVDYDRQAVIEATLKTGNPGAPYIVKGIQGRVHASWTKTWDGVAHVPLIIEGQKSE